LAAISISGCSKGLEGSPGTVKKRQTSSPVSASYAVAYPRTPNGKPLVPADRTFFLVGENEF